ncbi:MAG: alpha-2-macroglobulin [Reinekea sp.]
MYAKKSSIYVVWISLLFLLSSALQAADFYISDISETTEDNAPALVIRFTEAIHPDTDLNQFIDVTPFPDNGNVWMPQNNGRQWVLPFVEPSTEYTITVHKAPKSVSGQTLSKVDSIGQKYSFTRTITTRSLQPGATFASSGTFLVGNIQNGIPVTVVNQKEVDLDIFRVRDTELTTFINETQISGRMPYYRLNELDTYADLVHSARYQNDARKNQRTTYNFNLDPVLENNQPGVYIAVIRQAGKYDYYYDSTFFTITDIGLHVRQYHNSLMLYSHSVATGKPLSNVDLQFWWPETNHTDQREQRGRTGSEGSYQLAGNEMPRLVIARKGDQISFLKLNQNALDLSSYPNVPSLHREYQTFIYGPRDLYRPGEKVSINLLLRDFDGQKVRNMPLKARILDARGESKRNFTWQANSTGLYQTEFQLDDNAATGNWHLEVTFNDKDYQENYWFKVEEFLPETLTLSFYDGDRNQVRYAPKDSFSVPIQGDYLYGAPAAGNTADAQVTVSPATSLFKELKDYYFGDDEQNIPSNTYRISEVTLDDNGHGELDIPDDWSDVDIPLNFRVSASVYESGGRPITRTQNIIQLPAFDSLPGVQPQFKDRPASNQNVKFKLLSVDADGKPVSDTLKVRMLRYHHEYYWSYDESSGWYWDSQNHNYVTGSTTVEVEDEAASVEFPVEWGTYVLEVISQSGAKTRYQFTTQWSWYGQDSNSLKPDMLQLVLDKDAYQPGDSATVRLVSPVSGDGIINIESTNGVEFTLRQAISKGENNIQFDIPDDWKRHDFYVTAMVLAPADQVTEVAPKRAIGIAHLPLRRADADAEVVLTTVDKIEPNQIVNAHLQITNKDQLGTQKLYATVALVDKGVLNITNYQLPRPEDYFFAPRRFEASYYDTYGDIINNLGYDMLRQRFGGDMFNESDAELSRGGEKPKTEVQIVSFFSDPIELVNGEADVSFELPNFNGKLEWMVVVYGDRSYGSTKAETTVADRLVTQISMPRFIAMGDHSQLSFDLHNLSDADQTFDVSVEVTGAVISDGLRQKVKLSDKQKTVLNVPITGDDVEGQGVVTLNISNGSDIQVNRTWRLGVRSPYPWSTEELRAVIEPNTHWQPEIDISKLRENTVQAQLTISDRPAINFRSHLEYLLHYPYGCLEQTTSSTYPWILMNSDLVDQLGLNDTLQTRFDEPYTEQFRQTQIRKGLDRLKTKQLLNGGFGYWDSSSWEARWGTVYATEMMVDARKQGIAVDKQMLDSALKRLNEYLVNPAKSDLWSDSHAYYDFSHRAYAAFVLAKAKDARLSRVRRLFDQVKDSSLQQSGLAWMHLAGALEMLNDHNRAQEALDKALTIRRERYRYYRDYGSILRDDTLSLAIALELGLNEGNQAERMVEDLHDKRWMSTQERIALAKVARQYSKTSSDWTASLLTPSSEQELTLDHPFNSVFDASKLNSLQGVAANGKKLYASLKYQGAPINAPEPYQNGLRIHRRYYDLQGKQITPNQLTSGDLIIVSLTVSADDEVRIPDALVVDLLPAGLELENQNLSNASIDLDSINIDGSSLGEYFREYRVQYQEYRDDRYVAAIDVSYWSPTKLYYLARAVTPGTYSGYGTCHFSPERRYWQPFSSVTGSGRSIFSPAPSAKPFWPTTARCCVILPMMVASGVIRLPSMRSRTTILKH